jgi:hypothetical protein
MSITYLLLSVENDICNTSYACLVRWLNASKYLLFVFVITALLLYVDMKYAMNVTIDTQKNDFRIVNLWNN